jgi:hypothetical protein
MSKTKICRQCKSRKLLKYFYPELRGLYGRKSKCANCCRKNRKIYFKTPSSIKATKQYRNRTREERNRKQRERYKLPAVKAAKEAYRKKYSKKIDAKYRQAHMDKILVKNRNRRALKKNGRSKLYNK